MSKAGFDNKVKGGDELVVKREDEVVACLVKVSTPQTRPKLIAAIRAERSGRSNVTADEITLWKEDGRDSTSPIATE